jgi:hypothetical protein
MTARHMLWLAAAFVATAVFAPAARAQEVLAPAREGQLQCYQPDAVRKVCRAMASYVINADGSIDNGAEVLLLPDPLVIARGTTRVFIRDNAVCGPMTRAELDQMSFTADGNPLPEPNAVAIRDQIAAAPGALAEEVCTTYVPVDGGGFRADVTVDGVSQPDMSMPVIWVRADEGYRVAP